MGTGRFWAVSFVVSLALLVLTRWLITAMFMIDTVFATVGYALTMKPLDAHIRSANPYAAGWTAALICYPPFILMNPGGPLDYHIGAEEWSWWLEGHPWLIALLPRKFGPPSRLSKTRSHVSPALVVR